MKKIQIFGLIITLIMISFGCEEEKDPAGARGTAVMPSVSEPNPGIFIAGDENSYIEFEVDFEEGTQADQTSVVVSHGTNFERISIADLTTFPATVSFTLGEVLNILGTSMSAINTGDIIYVEVETTLDGITSRSNSALAIPVVCEFDPDLSVGNYRAVSADWAVDGAVTLTADPDDQYTIYVTGLPELDGLTGDLGPLVMHINSATLEVIADKTALASDVFGLYHNFSYEGTGSFNSCDGSYSMYFTITVDEGSFGAYSFTFTRM